MNPLAIKGIGILSLALILVGLGYHFGDKRATKEYLPQLSALKAVIEASDARAQETVTEQEKNHEQIAKSHSDNVASVVAFYDRMLRKARDKVGSSTPTEHPQVADDPTGQCGTCPQDFGFQQACALDAIRVLEWQGWAVLNQFPVE